jgi:hypothetical protein
MSNAEGKMGFKYRCEKRTSRMNLDYQELGSVVEQFVRMNALTNLTTDDLYKLRWLAVGLFHSPIGLPTRAWLEVNKLAEPRKLGIWLKLPERPTGPDDPRVQMAAARCVLSEKRIDGQHEAIDPLDPFPEAEEAAA